MKKTLTFIIIFISGTLKAQFDSNNNFQIPYQKYLYSISSGNFKFELTPFNSSGYTEFRNYYATGKYLFNVSGGAHGGQLNALAIISNGNIGIGTASPSGKLEINETINNSLTINSTTNFDNDQLVIRNSSTSTGSYAGVSFVGNANELLGRLGFKRHSFGNGRGEFFISVDDAGTVTEALLIDKSGNVGIGTNSPNGRLDVRGNIKLGDVKDSYLGVNALNNYIPYTSSYHSILNSGSNLYFNIDANGNDTSRAFVFATDRNGESGGVELFRISESGNVGIGRSNSSYKLHVAGDIRGASTVSVEKNGNYRVSMNGQTNGYIIARNDSNEQKFLIHSSGTSYFNGGNVGIGTTSPGNKLEVNGTIRSKKVKVEASGWPDYVFSKNYELRSLNELEKYIQENQHLPEVPSESEIEDKGLDLGAMDATLLKKVEELTLYLIQESKEKAELKKENKELKETLQSILKRLEKLESK